MSDGELPRGSSRRVTKSREGSRRNNNSCKSTSRFIIIEEHRNYGLPPPVVNLEHAAKSGSEPVNTLVWFELTIMIAKLRHYSGGPDYIRLVQHRPETQQNTYSPLSMRSQTPKGRSSIHNETHRFDIHEVMDIALADKRPVFPSWVENVGNVAPNEETNLIAKSSSPRSQAHVALIWQDKISTNLCEKKKAPFKPPLGGRG